MPLDPGIAPRSSGPASHCVRAFVLYETALLPYLIPTHQLSCMPRKRHTLYSTEQRCNSYAFAGTTTDHDCTMLCGLSKHVLYSMTSSKKKTVTRHQAHHPCPILARVQFCPTPRPHRDRLIGSVAMTSRQGPHLPLGGGELIGQTASSWTDKHTGIPSSLLFIAQHPPTACPTSSSSISH